MEIKLYRIHWLIFVQHFRRHVLAELSKQCHYVILFPTSNIKDSVTKAIILAFLSDYYFKHVKIAFALQSWGAVLAGVVVFFFLGKKRTLPCPATFQAIRNCIRFFILSFQPCSTYLLKAVCKNALIQVVHVFDALLGPINLFCNSKCVFDFGDLFMSIEQHLFLGHMLDLLLYPKYKPVVFKL